jgi:hypothetical protein
MVIQAPCRGAVPDPLPLKGAVGFVRYLVVSAVSFRVIF